MLDNESAKDRPKAYGTLVYCSFKAGRALILKCKFKSHRVLFLYTWHKGIGHKA
jgi:hypothetical protein